MKKVVHHLTRSTRILLILAAVLVALLMTSARILLPLVEDYHHDLESQLSRQIGKPVRVGELRAHLRGFYPELVLKEVSVLSPDQKVTAARLKEVRVGLSLSSFFKSAAVRPLWVTLIGAELTVTREKDGALSVYGLGSGKKKSEFPHWLFENGRFEVLESRLFWQNLKINGPIVELQNLHASLLNDEGRHQLNIEAALPEEKGRSLAIKMDYRGDIALADQWQGTVYLEGVGIFPAKILAGEQFEAFDIEKGRVDFKIWSEWKEASIKAVQGDLKLSDPAVSWQLEKTGHREKLALKLFSGLFRLKMAENGWNLAATELVVTRNGESRQQKEAVTIDYQNDSVRIAGSFLNLAEIRDLLLESSLLKKEQAELLFGTAPSGHLTDFSVVAQLAEGEFKGGWFCGRFNKIKLEAWRKVPGVENFEGRFCGSERQGFVELGTGNAQINLASLFRTPWQISNNQGRIHWQKQQQGWRLFSDGFAVETPDIKTVTRFDLVFEEGKSPFIDLQSTFQEGIVANAGFYYPVKVMPNHVVSWLDQALVSGEVISGGARLYGRLGEFPFSKNEGVFEVLFDVKNTQLNYQKSWPPLTDIGAEVRFYQDDLVISADQAVLEGEQVEWAEVSIKGLRHAQWLNISGEVSGDVSESMRFLQHSPLHNRVDALLHVVDVHGRNKIKIDIDVPLRKGIGLAKVSGTAVLNNANLVIRGVELNVDAVNGLLAFDEAGIEGKGLQALVLNEAVTIDLLRGKKGLLLKAKGWAGIAELSKQFPLPIWPYLEGKAAYDLSLTIPMNGGKNLSTLLKLRSDTKGIALNLPAPYGKSVNEKRAFSMSLPLKAGNKTKMALRYADDVRVGLLFTAPGEKPFKLLKGEIRLDGRKPLLPEKGLRLAGALSHFDVAPWVMLEKNGPAIKESDRGKDELLQELALKFEQLVWGERRFNHVGFNLKRARASWEGAITSQFGGGFMQLPDDLSGHSPLVLKFDRLNVPDGEPEVDNRSTKAKQETFNPAELPNLNISAKRLILKGENLGALQLVTERIAHGVRIKQLMIESDKDQLKSSGEWVSSANGENKTAFNGTLESKDLGNLIKRLGITQALKSEDDKVSFSLSWKGSPWDMQVNSINGQFGLALGKGRLVDVELGAGRLLGLLSLQTIQRRLTLDFSDLFAKGLSFDDVKAHYKVVSGDAWTDDFFLDGPVARIDIQGRMGLAKRDYDQTVVVTPKTTENLPLASALVGGPVVGAAVFVAQKLIGDRVEKVTRSRYSLAGSWDRPELTLLGQNKPWMEQILDRVWTGLSGQDAVIEGGAK